MRWWRRLLGREGGKWVAADERRDFHYYFVKSGSTLSSCFVHLATLTSLVGLNLAFTFTQKPSHGVKTSLPGVSRIDML